MKHKSLRLLSILAAFVLLFSTTVPVYADTFADDEPTDAIELEMEDIDPSSLNVPRLGDIEDDEDLPVDDSTFLDPNRVVRVSILLNQPSTIEMGYSTENIAQNSNATAYRAALRRSQDTVQKAIEAELGKPLDVKWNLTLAANIISANVKYPKIAQENSIQGRVIVQFVVAKDGKIENVEVVRTGGDPSLDREAVRVIKSMPRWQPGKQRGKLVRVKYTVPVNFRLQ